MITYGPSDASKRTGVSASTTRTYADQFDAFFSASASGRPRRFTEDDLRIIAYINERIQYGDTYKDIQRRLEAGEHHGFVFASAVREEQSEDEEPTAGTLVISRDFMAALQAQMAEAEQRERRLLEDLKEEHGRSRQREEQLLRELGEAREQIGRLAGQMEEM